MASTFEARASGILLHPTSFPGRCGIGELGPSAYHFVDWLDAAGQQLWQILPLNPTGYGDSPYASPSAFAGNPLLISLDQLAADGLIEQYAIDSAPQFPEDHVDFGWIIQWKGAMLESAYRRFVDTHPTELTAAFQAFCGVEASWLDDYALFRSLKAEHDGAWNSWPEGLRLRDPNTLAAARGQLRPAIDYHRFVQFLFFRQWRALKAYANRRGIRIVGDVPIFVAYDSADVWAHRDLFQLDQQGEPTVVTGVPPDYFSVTGQLWGNPHYRWDALKDGGYQWWIDRVRTTLSTVDLIRIDHFRGFQAAWEVPASEETAERGRWVPGPGAEIFHAFRRALGHVPIIAEDLGLITAEVDALRDELELPGMKVLQFAFDGNVTNPHLPYNYGRNFVVYSGTHDNDTTVGWFSTAPPGDRFNVHTYLGTTGQDIAWDLIRLGFTSVAIAAIAPLQDILSLGTHARMNAPGRPIGNWGWRYRAGALSDELAQKLRRLTALTGRLALEPAAPETFVSD